MSLIGLLVLVLFACVIAYLARAYLPTPFSWIVIGVVVIVLLVGFVQMSGVGGNLGNIKVGN